MDRFEDSLASIGKLAGISVVSIENEFAPALKPIWIGCGCGFESVGRKLGINMGSVSDRSGVVCCNVAIGLASTRTSANIWVWGLFGISWMEAWG